MSQKQQIGGKALQPVKVPVAKKGGVVAGLYDNLEGDFPNIPFQHAYSIPDEAKAKPGRMATQKVVRGAPLSTPPRHKPKAGVPPPPSKGYRTGKLSTKMAIGEVGKQPLPKIPSNKSPASKVVQGNDQSLTDVEKVLYGNLSHGLPTTRAGFIRVFLSSTFSDLKAERNQVWSTVYPRVKGHCLSHKLDFNFIDMRWGVVDYATNNHITEDIVLDEVDRCIEVSAATSFVSIIGHRYGSLMNSRLIPANQYEILLDMAERHNLQNHELLRTWYKRDQNNIPAVYVLQPISSLLTDFLSADVQKKSAASNEWNRVSDCLRVCMERATRLAVEENKLQRELLDQMEKSVTATEIEKGIINNPSAVGTTMSFYRVLQDIESGLNDAAVSRFVDVNVTEGTTVINKSHQQSITKFILDPVKALLPTNDCRELCAQWKPGGIPSDVSKQTEEDKKYLGEFASLMSDMLMREIDDYVKKRAADQMKEYEVTAFTPRFKGEAKRQHVCTKECIMKCAKNSLTGLVSGLRSAGEHDFNQPLPAELYKEILHHLKVVGNSCSIFGGRKKELELVRKYLNQHTWSSPLIIHAPSGEGKTSLLSEVAKRAHQPHWLDADSVVAIRVLGTSRASKSILSTLRSVYDQLCCAYALQNNLSRRTTYKSLQYELNKLLNSVSTHPVFGSIRPCLIMFDSVDSLSPSNNPQSLSWLPDSLPPNVYWIVTFTSDSEGSVQAAQEKSLNVMKLPAMEAEELMGVMQCALTACDRALSSEQWRVISQRIYNNPNPLFMKLLFCEAVLWTSYSMVTDVSALYMEAILKLFSRLEDQYGAVFVAHCLSYITLCLYGIAERELQEVLSCSDEVLVDVYVYHPPPVDGQVRIPSHLWPMLYKELKHYIEEKRVDDEIVLSWHHKQFNEAVRQKYLQNGEVEKQMYQNMAEVYTATNGVYRTITLSRLRQPLTVRDADRQVSAQPVAEVSLLRLYAMSYYVMKTQDSEMFKREILSNLDFLRAAWKADSIKMLSEVMMLGAKDTVMQDEELAILKTVLCLYTERLYSEPYSDDSFSLLCIHLIGHLPECETMSAISSLVRQAEKVIENESRAGLQLRPVQGCMFTVKEDLQWFSSGYASLSAAKDGGTISLQRSTDGCWLSIDVREMKPYKLTLTPNPRDVQVTDGAVFALNDDAVQVRRLRQGSVYKSTLSTSSVKGVKTNRMMAVSHSGSLVVLAGDNILTVHQASDTESNKLTFKGTGVLKLTGVVSTDALAITTDGKFVISAHTIQSKAQKTGGIVKWDYTKTTTEARLGIPAPALPGRLYLLSNQDLVLFATSNKEVMIASLKEQRIVERLYGGPQPWTNMEVDGNLVALTVADRQVQIWNTSNKQLVTIKNLKSAPKAISLMESHGVIAVGTCEGTVELFTTQKGRCLTSLQLSGSSITQLALLEGHVAVVDETSDCYLLMMNDRQEFNQPAVSLETQTANMEQAFLAAPLDGWDSIKYCGSSSYVAAIRSHELRVWDYKHWQELSAPAAISSLVDCVSCYAVCPRNQTVILAGNSRIARWDLKMNTAHVFISSDDVVTRIEASDSLAVLLISSGGGQQHLQLVRLSDGHIMAQTGCAKPVSGLACTETSAFFRDRLYMLAETLSQELPYDNIHSISACGRTVTAANRDSVLLLNAENGEKIGSALFEMEVINIFHISPDRTLIVHEVGTVQLLIWDKTKSDTMLSNPVQTRLAHISAIYDDANDNLINLIGRRLNQTACMALDVKEVN